MTVKELKELLKNMPDDMELSSYYGRFSKGEVVKVGSAKVLYLTLDNEDDLV